MEELEKKIYNCYLAVTRSCQNKPFSLRKNFDNFETSEEGIFTKKLYNLFQKFPEIDWKLFFEAPYKLYSNESEYYPLKFYTTQKAINCYSIYKKKIEMKDLENDDQMQKIKNTLVFIAKFCDENNLTLENYLKFKKGITNIFLIHLKENSIQSPYVLLCFPEFECIINSLETDEQDLFVDNILNNWVGMKTNLNRNYKIKNLIENNLKNISDFLKKRLANS